MIILFLFSYINIARVEGIIQPATVEYAIRAINEAEKGAECLIITLDTPGGLDEAMRDLTKKILNATVPVIVYIYPSGARCASAGVFITMTAHISAMALGTNIGAAHPVAMGQEMDSTMSKKVENDAVAYIKSIAKRRGKNEKWVEEAVRKSASITAEEAVEKNVVDMVAENIDSLIAKINGKEVELPDGKRVLNTKNQEVREIKWRFKESFLSKIANPNIAYILMMIGIWGIIAELTHPGTVFPGIAGAISLIMAFYAFQVLPINYAGLALIILGFVLLVMEAITPTFGPLAIGGITAMILGSTMLIQTDASFMQISLVSIITVVGAMALFLLIGLGMVFKAMRKKAVSGKEGLVGSIAVVKEKINKEDGRVFIDGEWWNAVADEEIEEKTKVRIVEVNGMVLKVRKN